MLKKTLSIFILSLVAISFSMTSFVTTNADGGPANIIINYDTDITGVSCYAYSDGAAQVDPSGAFKCKFSLKAINPGDGYAFDGLGNRVNGPLMGITGFNTATHNVSCSLLRDLETDTDSLICASPADTVDAIHLAPATCGDYDVFLQVGGMDPNIYSFTNKALSVSCGEQTADLFTDVDSTNIFKEHIENLKKDGIINGFNGKFSPKALANRGEMAVFIKNAFGIPTNTDCGDFSDMNSTTPFYSEATSLKCAGIIMGSDDGNGGREYLPGNPVTRGEMAVFIKNAANNSTEKIPTNTSCGNFVDMDENTPFYSEATSLKCAGVIKGYTDGTYRYTNYVPREQLAVFVDNGRKL